jgi:hypothetical protein
MEVSGELHILNALHPQGMGDWVAPEPIWTLWRKEKSLTPAGNRTLDVHPVASYTILIYFILNIQGWSPYWVHSALRPLLAYCTSQRLTASAMARPNLILSTYRVFIFQAY